MEQPESELEKVRRKLYSRTSTNLHRERRLLSANPIEVNERFVHEEGAPPRRSLSSLSLFFIFSVGFFFLSIAIGAFFFFGGGNTVSGSNIDIALQGPTTIGGGEELALQLAITNENAIPIESADLLIEYPDGTRSAENLSVEMPRYREGLGDLGPQETIQRSIRAVLFGEENQEHVITVTVEYRVAGSNAIFYTEKEYPIIISSAPLSLTLTVPDEAISGQDLPITVTLTSNSDAIIRNALLVAEYPFGFTFKSGSPKPSSGSTVWNLGDIQPGGIKTITLNGRMEGQDGEERIFRFSSGIAKDDDELALGATFIASSRTLVVKRPFIGLNMAVNGSDVSSPVASGNTPIRVDLTWTNNLPVSIYDVEITARLSGSALNKQTVVADGGFFRSIDSTVLWNPETQNSLREIRAGESGRVSFSLTSSQLGSIRNPQIQIEISARGRRISEENVPEEVTASLSRAVKINSDLAVAPRLAHITGPLPPKAEQKTRYKVTWRLTNSANQVGDVRVSASLPPYVTFIQGLGSEPISFNPLGGGVVWEAGNVSSTGGAREASFEIEFLPSVTQINLSPVLITETRVSGVDRFTGKSLEVQAAAVTTRITDGSAPTGSDIVQP